MAQLLNPFERIVTMLTEAHSPGRHFPATLLYNEGWMLRLVLDWFASQPSHDHPLSFSPAANWYSEALLPSQFFASRRGDPLAEGWTHADGVIGHVTIGDGALANTKLKPDASQFIVTEAKLSSPLSPGVKNAPDYDQAARNVACMAQVLSESGIELTKMPSMGFHVLAPESQIASGVFAGEMNEVSIRGKVEQRISAYRDPEVLSSKMAWYEHTFLPTLNKIKISCLSWEAIIDHITHIDPPFGNELSGFYMRCSRFNEKSNNLPK